MGAKITLCLIARDEEAMLAAAIDSVRPIISEIIVVDTGSTDSTKELASALGAKVFEFRWQNDFAAARNFGLARCTQDWILVLDCDERISETDHPTLISLPKANHAFQFIQRHYVLNTQVRGFTPCKERLSGFEQNYPGYFETSCVRLFPNHPEIRFEGRVHELVEPSIANLPSIAVIESGIRLHHYGHVRGARTFSKSALYAELAMRKAQESSLKWKALFELGVELCSAQNYAASAAAFSASLTANPQHFATFVNLGFVLTELGRYAEAENVLLQALARNDYAADVHLNLGVVYMRAGHLERAEQHFSKAADLHPWDVNTWCNLGKLHMIRGKLQEADRAYQQALEVIDSYAPAILERGVIAMQRGDLSAAEPLLRRAAEHLPSDCRAYYYLGKTLQQLGKVEDALKALTTFISIESSNQAREPNAAASAVLENVKREVRAWMSLPNA